MFKDDYKKRYDNIHPSPELVERTKKMALEQYQNKSQELEVQNLEEKKREEESYETEKVEYAGEEKIIFLGMEKRKILRIAGGFAAGLVLVTAGYFLSGTLKQQGGTVGSVADNTTEPTGISIPSSTPLSVEEKDEIQQKKNNSSKKNESQEQQQYERLTNTVTSLAKMGNGDGVKLDYVSNNLVIFHGNFGILGYSLSSRQIVVQIPAGKYQFPDIWLAEMVMVNQEGTQIAWYGTASSSMQIEVYDISTGTYSQMDSAQWQEENAVFSGAIAISETDADVYSSKAANMCVKLSESKVCQLIYQAPSLSLQASLGIAVVDIDAGTEQIYDVFGNIGRQIAASYGVSYGGYHNDRGEKLFESKLEENEIPEETTEPEIEPTEIAAATEEPEEIVPTPEQESEENITKPEETETPPKTTPKPTLKPTPNTEATEQQ